jgi:hypothetical protein
VTAVTLLALAGAAVFLGVFARGWWRDLGGVYAPQAITAAARVTPASSLFGDVLTAQVDVLLDPAKVDPASVEISSDFRPFEVRSQSRSVERNVERADVISFRYAIECTTRPCIPLLSTKTPTSSETNPVQLKPAALTGRSRDGKPVTLEVRWPPFVVHSRLTAEEIGLSTPQFEPVFAPAKISFRFSPDLVGAVSVSLAVLLALGAAWLASSPLLGDTRRLRILRIPSHLTSVERALRLAEHAAASGELAEERKALERLAVELRRAGASELAGRAGRLAWAGERSPDTVGALAEAVRSNGAH